MVRGLWSPQASSHVRTPKLCLQGVYERGKNDENMFVAV